MNFIITVNLSSWIHSFNCIIWLPCQAFIPDVFTGSEERKYNHNGCFVCQKAPFEVKMWSVRSCWLGNVCIIWNEAVFSMFSICICMCVAEWKDIETNCMFPFSSRVWVKILCWRGPHFQSTACLSAGCYDPHNVCQCGFCPSSTLYRRKKGLSSCKYFHWKYFSNHLRPAVVFGIRAGLLAFLGYERFVLAN